MRQTPMLIGATQILGPVPARSLDPIVLILSQHPGMRGYVLLSARESADPEQHPAGRTWDAILLAGNAEPDCMRLTETARALLPFARVPHELQTAGGEGRSVYLFEAPERLLRDFLSTAHADPVLKVALDSLDARQIETLLASSPLRQGLLERSDLSGDLPRFELVRISTVVEGLGIPFVLPQLQLGYEKGGIALYPLDPAIGRAAPGTWSQASMDYGVEMESALISGASDSAPKARKGAAGNIARLVRPRHPPLPSPHHPSGTAPGEPDQVIIIFQRLFRSFRKKAVDCLGSRWEDDYRSAVEKVRFLTPEFQPDTLTSSTAPQILDLILELTASAPLLRRSRLREAALLLLAEIYDKHYDMLETRGLVDRVEHAYLRLKK